MQDDGFGRVARLRLVDCRRQGWDRIEEFDAEQAVDIVNRVQALRPALAEEGGCQRKAEAKGTDKVALAELEASYQPNSKNQYKVSVAKAEGTFKKTPDRDQFAADINESLIVELYSR